MHCAHPSPHGLAPAAGAPDTSRPAPRPLLALAPPHLALAAAGSAAAASRMHATYLAFGNRGDKIVGTYHADHAFAFDISGAAATSSESTPSGGPAVDLFAGAAACATPCGRRAARHHPRPAARRQGRIAPALAA